MLMSTFRNNSLFPVRIAQALINLIFSTPYMVEGDSMSPNLADRQYVLAASCRFSWNRPRRGDVVVFRHPILEGHIYVKRVVGLPDEDLRLAGSNVYIGGRLLEETYLSSRGIPTSRDRAPTVHQKASDREWWLGPDEYFVMSDNRGQGQDDSRAFGPVNKQLIKGRVWFRYWPPRYWGPIPGRSKNLDGTLG